MIKKATKPPTPFVPRKSFVLKGTSLYYNYDPLPPLPSYMVVEEGDNVYFATSYAASGPRTLYAVNVYAIGKDNVEVRS